ncbi:hypothetical protein DF157_27760 [Burkholderia cenocepacia]|nr:hypothetical protein DF157_27760 [Burkholderia cenocepacia]RQU46494.1 hypothetical protein DF142_02465 [Burkholderia cenocepacia]RQU74096.1 hypothetical protein DF140_02465 [Burkholderia cenocepacia]RQU96186.1 hypothetical protein DF040_00440 [Burkholderia cenocepacia]RQV33657.1 hypothetical protein DF027_29425 [Burkholderia cenocepacia]
MNGSAVSRQNGDGTADRLAVRLTRRAPGSNDERSPYKTVRRRATALAWLRCPVEWSCPRK